MKTLSFAVLSAACIIAGAVRPDPALMYIAVPCLAGFVFFLTWEWWQEVTSEDEL